MKNCYVVFSLIISFFSIAAFSQLPLCSDNTGALGTNKFQVELSDEFATEHEDAGHELVNGTELVLTWGFLEKADLVLGNCYQYTRFSTDTLTETTQGFADMSLEVKLNLYQSEHISVAVKPGISLPTGDYEKGLGAGKFGYTGFFITSFEYSKWLININAGYLRNENKIGDKVNIWSGSASFDYAMTDKFHTVADFGFETNAMYHVHEHPVFGLFGFIYLINNDTEISGGYKRGLTKVEADNSCIVGLTKRF